jgi:hypothetical protein
MGIVCASFEADVNVVVDMSAVLPDAIVPNGGMERAVPADQGDAPATRRSRQKRQEVERLPRALSDHAALLVDDTYIQSRGSRAGEGRQK